MSHEVIVNLIAATTTRKGLKVRTEIDDAQYEKGIKDDTCRTPRDGESAPTFEVLTSPNSKQKRAIELLQQINV